MKLVFVCGACVFLMSAPFVFACLRNVWCIAGLICWKLPVFETSLCAQIPQYTHVCFFLLDCLLYAPWAQLRRDALKTSSLLSLLFDKTVVIFSRWSTLWRYSVGNRSECVPDRWWRENTGPMHMTSASRAFSRWPFPYQPQLSRINFFKVSDALCPVCPLNLAKKCIRSKIW